MVTGRGVLSGTHWGGSVSLAMARRKQANPRRRRSWVRSHTPRRLIFDIPDRARALMDRLMADQLHGIGYESDEEVTEDYNSEIVTPKC